jgi:hypothetical protein
MTIILSLGLTAHGSAELAEVGSAAAAVTLMIPLFYHISPPTVICADRSELTARLETA